MPIDYSLLPLSKGTPAKLLKADRTKARDKVDEAESAKVRARSKGRCEVVWFGKKARKVSRCGKRASEVHHLIGGHGRRGRGISAKAERKIHACQECHSKITGHVLRRVGGELPHWTDEYEDVGK